jgi:hypothetical protein
MIKKDKAWPTRVIECYREVGVEKLLLAKSARIKSRQEALQSIFSVRLDIFYPPNFG